MPRKLPLVDIDVHQYVFYSLFKVARSSGVGVAWGCPESRLAALVSLNTKYVYTGKL